MQAPTTNGFTTVLLVPMNSDGGNNSMLEQRVVKLESDVSAVKVQLGRLELKVDHLDEKLDDCLTKEWLWKSLFGTFVATVVTVLAGGWWMFERYAIPAIEKAVQ
jgi:hypothetical protein